MASIDRTVVVYYNLIHTFILEFINILQLFTASLIYRHSLSVMVMRILCLFGIWKELPTKSRSLRRNSLPRQRGDYGTIIALPINTVNDIIVTGFTHTLYGLLFSICCLVSLGNTDSSTSKLKVFAEQFNSNGRH